MDSFRTPRGIASLVKFGALRLETRSLDHWLEGVFAEAHSAKRRKIYVRPFKKIYDIAIAYFNALDDVGQRTKSTISRNLRER